MQTKTQFFGRAALVLVILATVTTGSAYAQFFDDGGFDFGGYGDAGYGDLGGTGYEDLGGAGLGDAGSGYGDTGLGDLGLGDLGLGAGSGATGAGNAGLGGLGNSNSGSAVGNSGGSGEIPLQLIARQHAQQLCEKKIKPPKMPKKKKKAKAQAKAEKLYKKKLASLSNRREKCISKEIDKFLNPPASKKKTPSTNSGAGSSSSSGTGSGSSSGTGTPAGDFVTPPPQPPSQGGGSTVRAGNCNEVALPASDTGGCHIRLVTPARCETIDLSGGRSYEFAWTTGGSYCETPYKAYLGGNPVDINTGKNTWEYSFSENISGGISKTGGGVKQVNASAFEGLTSVDGMYHWVVTGRSGSHPDSQAFYVKK